MEHTFELYRTAAEKVNRGWARGKFRSAQGNICLVQGVLDAAHLTGENLPADMITAIDQRLAQRSISYRMMRQLAIRGGVSLQEPIMLWNDTRRNKNSVVSILHEVADELELQWLRAERLRLTKLVDQLTKEVEDLKARVATLEAENGFLRRLTNSRTLRADRRQLEELETELADKWEQLTALADAPTK